MVKGFILVIALCLPVAAQWELISEFRTKFWRDRSQENRGGGRDRLRSRLQDKLEQTSRVGAELEKADSTDQAA
jgi:hypothetical protein